MLPGCLVYVWCETKSNPGSELLGLARDNGPLHLSLESCCAWGREARLYTSCYLLEATSYFFVTIEDQTFQFYQTLWPNVCHPKITIYLHFGKEVIVENSHPYKVVFPLIWPPQIGWKLYILLPAMLLHGPEMWGGWPSCSIWLGCQADDLWPQSLHHHLLPRLPGLACRNCWVKWSSLVLPFSFVRDTLA